MLAVCQWHQHPGRAIGCRPGGGVRRCGAVVRDSARRGCHGGGGSERPGRRGISTPSCWGWAPGPRLEFKSGPSPLCERWGGGSWRRRRRRGRRRKGEEEGLDASVMLCRNSSAAPCVAESEASSKCPPESSPSHLLPLAAVALIFSRAGVLMGGCVDAVFRSGRAGGVRSRRNVEEFVEAARGRRPWRPGLERALTRQGGVGLALLSATAIAQDRLTPVIATLRANPTFMSGLIAWAIAQVAKVFTYYVVVRQWDFRMVMGSGGMPSSHSALCFALTTSVAFTHGVSDALFPVCLGFTLIVMYDAAGVRRHAGRQAEVLNMIVADLFQGHPIRERKLKELLGHTPLQVFAGAALGVVVGYICSRPRLT